MPSEGTNKALNNDPSLSRMLCVTIEGKSDLALAGATFPLKGGQWPQPDILWTIWLELKTQMRACTKMYESPRKTEAVGYCVELRKINEAKSAKRWYGASTVHED